MNDIKQQVYSRFLALSPRDRVIALAGVALLIAVIFYLAVLMPLYKATNDRATRVTHKQADLAWMRSVSGDLQAMGGLPGGVDGASESLVVLIDRSAHESGLGDALTGQTPNGASIRVSFEGASFDSLVQWLGALQQQHGVAVESASIDRTAKEGVVNANLVLNRA